MNEMRENQMNSIGRQNEEVTIDLLELFFVLWRKAKIIVGVMLLFAILAAVGTKMFIAPKYTAETKMYVLSKQDASANVTYSDLQVSSQLVKDYMELVYSTPVLDETISKLSLDMEEDELKSMISVENASDTRIIGIKVTSTDPEQAKDIANEVREAVGDQIVKVTDADAVNTVEEAKTPTEPSAPSLKKNTALGGILGLLLTSGIIILLYLLDDTIKDKDDVEKYLGLNVLTIIPIVEGVGRDKGSQKSKKKR